MTDLLIGVIAGAVLVLLGMAAGVAWTIVHTVRDERARVAQERKPVCGCRHHYSFHAEGGACNWVTPSDYSRNELRCGCQKYVGPRPEEIAP